MNTLVILYQNWNTIIVIHFLIITVSKYEHYHIVMGGSCQCVILFMHLLSLSDYSMDRPVKAFSLLNSGVQCA